MRLPGVRCHHPGYAKGHVVCGDGDVLFEREQSRLKKEKSACQENHDRRFLFHELSIFRCPMRLYRFGKANRFI
jgi:hypothetical protein